MTKNNKLARLAAAGFASAALIATVACNGNGIDTVRAEQRDPRLLQMAANGSQLGTATSGNQQMLVNCGPYQRTLVRTTYVNGQPIAAVDCVPSEETAAAPAGYVQQYAPASAQRVVYTAAPAPRVIRTVSAPAATRTVAPRTVERRAVRSKTKSAVIIGTSAAAGAGVGALIGGKKGALIGAVAGGGSAAIWDQVTRRKDR